MILANLLDSNTQNYDTSLFAQSEFPMGSIDKFLGREKNEKYNCADFAAELWEYLTGKPAAYLVRGWSIESRSRLQRIEKAVSPCIIIMYHKRVTPHVGIFVRGRVVHLVHSVEVATIDVATRGFRNHRFYVPK